VTIPSDIVYTIRYCLYHQILAIPSDISYTIRYLAPNSTPQF